MIFYFTGTGNSAYIAQQLAERCGDTLDSINARIRSNDFSTVSAPDRLVFVVPTYAWRIPRLVERWIADTPFFPHAQAYFVMTCGDSVGNAQKYIRRLCVKKEFVYMGLLPVIMPENYIALFDAPEEAAAQEIVRQAGPSIAEAAACITQGIAFPYHSAKVGDKICSAFLNPLFYRFLVKSKKFRAGAACTGCGKCARECPLHNISLPAGRPVWDSRCTHCMACICKCPEAAIEYGRSSVGRVRYQCPY